MHSLMVFLLLTGAFLAAGLLSATLIVLLKPFLVRYALARPNARSSHTTPTPQGGGIAVLIATWGAVGLVFLATGEMPSWPADSELIIVAGASLSLALVGAVDDIRPLPVGLRLALQVAAITTIVWAIDVERLPEAVPPWATRAFLILAGLWFVNLVNFMDGLDWMTVAEMVPITAFVVVAGFTLRLWLGKAIPTDAMLVAAALCGALLGFAPFNKPVARLFLGDVGSLPIGLLVGWLLLNLAATGAFATTILPPLYYLGDATITLLRRLSRGERIWEAHRSHFYQQATDNGFSPFEVSAHVFGLNLALAALAGATLVWRGTLFQGGALLIGSVLVGAMLWRFARPRSMKGALA